MNWLRCSNNNSFGGGGTSKGFPRLGFTLAEVLITLGIIGVVAAMTIPNLMSNIRAQQYTKKYKKIISTLANAGRMSSELYGFDYAGINVKCGSNFSTEHPDVTQSICAMLNGTLSAKTTLKGINNIPNYKFTSSSFDRTYSFASDKNTLPVYLLSDGTIIILNYLVSTRGGCTFDLNRNSAATSNVADGTNMYYGNGCYAMIDLNGTALPNKETICSNGVETVTTGFGGKKRGPGNCVVKNKDINDIFFVVFYDGMAEPWTNAGWYVYNNSK